jgi:Predicted metal-dependent phosphoesterases (PHP family)
MSGTELSSEYKKQDVHILGYLFDIENEKFNKMLKNYRDVRNNRGAKMIELLEKEGLKFDADDKAELLKNHSVGRPHVADLLVKYNYISSRQEAFEKYIGAGCCAYVAKFKLTIKEAVDYIKEAGGLAVLAHPGLNGDLMDDVISEAMSVGIDGIEVYHESNTKEVRRYLLQIAEKNNLFVTGGSDFHTHNDSGHGEIGSLNYDYSNVKNIFENHNK